MIEENEEEEFSDERGIETKEGEEGKAILIGVYSGLANKVLCEEHLDELENLTDTFGATVLKKIATPLRKIDAATYLQKGKLEEVALEIQNSKANLLIIDEEISPAQQRNLEKLLKVAIMDRTELILEIFAARAETKEAKLQISLAKARYEFPRLKRLWSHFSRQRASGGYLKGEGETQLEIDRRILRKRVERLNDELKEVVRARQVQRSSRLRSGIPTFAIVGYTNVGKSTLLKALTDADVLVEDKLFATLDTTTRKFALPNGEEVLLTDTVGFIRKLPHALVAAFKSTLESAVHDDVLIHIIDVSHPAAEEQAETVLALLKELDANLDSVITVLNKVDACTDPNLLFRLRTKYPKTALLSAIKREGFDDLAELMMEELKTRRILLKLRIPQSEYPIISLIRREGKVISQEYEENDILLTVEVPKTMSHQFIKFKVEE